MNDKVADSSPLGFLGLAVAAWMTSMVYAGWFGQDQLNTEVGHASMLFGAAALGFASIFQFVRGNRYYAVLFAASGLFFWIWIKSMGTPSAAAFSGWFDLIWTIFFAAYWLSSFKRPAAVMLTVLGVAVTFLFHTLATFGATGLVVIAGYTGMIAGLLALYVAAGQLLADGGAFELPATTEGGGSAGGGGHGGL